MANEETLATICFNKIRSLILQGKFLPGERLKGDYLKQILEVGSSPIREALTKLSSTEMVEFKDKSGFSVARISEAKVQDAFKTFAKIECLLLKEAISLGDDTWEAGIMAALYKLSKVEAKHCETTYKTWAQRNDEFHDALISACNLLGLKKIRSECALIKEWYTNLCHNDIANDIVSTNHSEHALLAELAIARKDDNAINKLYNHIVYDLKSIISKLKIKGFIR